MAAGRLQALRQDELIRHTAILFFGMMVVHVSNLAFQMLVSRRLPEVEYALLAAFLAALGIISYPLVGLTTGLGHYCSLLHQEKRTGDIRRLLWKWLGLTGAPALVFSLLAVIYHQPVAAFLYLDRAAPVIIAGAVLPAVFWFPVLTGAAQGLQMFGWNTASAILGALLKFMLGAGLVWLWYPACGWAMAGHSAGIYLSTGVLLFGLWLVLRRHAAGTDPLPSLRLYLGKSFIVQMSFAALMNADVILVKHFLPDDVAFPYAATLGRIVAFMPMAIAFAMFPKVSSSGVYSQAHRSIFLRSFLYTALCVAGAALVCLVFPALVLRVLFGIRDASAALIDLARMMTVAMSACALLNVTVQFLLAQRRFAGLVMTVFSCLLYLASARWYHESSMDIALAAIVFNGLALVTSLVAAFRLKPSA